MNYEGYNEQHQIRLEENQNQTINFKNDFLIRIKLFLRSIRRTQKKFIILNLLLFITSISLISLILYSKQTKNELLKLTKVSFLSTSSTSTQPDGLLPITREVLEKLDQLQNSFDEEDGVHQDSQSTIDPSNQKMPMVTSLPTKPSPATHSSNTHHSSIPAEELDRSICPNQTSLGLSCSFLLPGFIGEQETKAQVHLHQLGLLAIQLNRTLVLPNVSKSRMGTCLSYPFDLYYQTESLNRLGIHTISYHEFIDWTFNRFPNPSAQLVSISDSKIHHSDHTLVKIESDSIETYLSKLPSYISIHWRQETLSIERLKKCSSSLIPRLLKIQKSFPSLTSIYLSTDYPIEEVLNPKQTVIAHSSTFSKLITQDHHVLMKTLFSEIHQIQSDLKFFSFDQLIKQIDLNEEMIKKLIKLPNVMELIKLNKLIPSNKDSKVNEKDLVI
ncbi:uncharacterized protein MELLADRAFT_116555 [Melampsora larici-populina 98AG31]|uniref:Uncharacterized protein n=1 Tax=Melampsora larici-populina (strain 98AG31 / pathotype 3-4-7) TaxID=747676 RepID=F4RML7_MELLP|nr:uncharacterized protein MELLADRAFT_116555 [Melampsora larici-populina 98AG31]EGG06443.1 hypothetical protein MELLADRAFT_116555 [Melampsora larici-populina 98AG31]